MVCLPDISQFRDPQLISVPWIPTISNSHVLIHSGLFLVGTLHYPTHCSASFQLITGMAEYNRDSGQGGLPI